MGKALALSFDGGSIIYGLEGQFVVSHMLLPETAEEFRVSLFRWVSENAREYPWREQERSRYEVFVAEFFLTQTPADNVADVYPIFIRLCQAANTRPKRRTGVQPRVRRPVPG